MLELAGLHAQEVLADTSEILRLAEERAREIPAVPGLVREVQSLQTLCGELLIRLTILEHGVEELLREAGRPGLVSRENLPLTPVEYEIRGLRAELAALRSEVLAGDARG
jgi:hypothetical protein